MYIVRLCSLELFITKEAGSREHFQSQYSNLLSLLNGITSNLITSHPIYRIESSDQKENTDQD